MNILKVALKSDIELNSGMVIMVKGNPIALFNVGGKFIAWDNRCPHRGASLADGNISEDIIQCKFHLWEFDVKKACALQNQEIKVKTYTIKIQGDEIYLVL